MAKKRYKKKETLSDAIKLIVIGLLLGTVFTFGVQFWRATVTREDCTVVETAFVNYDYRRSRHGGKLHFSERLTMVCTDGETYIFNGELISKALLDSLALLSPNEPITLLLHPNGNRIMELSTESEVILAFDEAMKRMESARTGFFYMGFIMCGGSLYGVYLMVKVLKRRKQYSQSKKGKGRHHTE